MVGGGLEYQFGQDIGDCGINFIPLYGLVQYKFNQFYAVGRLGYDLFNMQNFGPPGYSFTGGIYYGVGAGYNINRNMEVEAVYGICNMSQTFLGDTIMTGTSSKLGLSFGYKF